MCDKMFSYKNKLYSSIIEFSTCYTTVYQNKISKKNNFAIRALVLAFLKLQVLKL